MVGGADIVILDWTPRIRLRLSGQHSGSRLRLFSHTRSLRKSSGVITDLNCDWSILLNFSGFHVLLLTQCSFEFMPHG